jgi:hypothetical protein
MLREGNSTDVYFAEANPGKDDGEGDDGLEPESDAVLASLRKIFFGHTVIVDEENDLSPDQG